MIRCTIYRIQSGVQHGPGWLLLTGLGSTVAFSFISVHKFDRIARHQKNECVAPQAIPPR
jgi:hypothetical protein